MKLDDAGLSLNIERPVWLKVYAWNEYWTTQRRFQNHSSLIGVVSNRLMGSTRMEVEHGKT